MTIKNIPVTLPTGDASPFVTDGNIATPRPLLAGIARVGKIFTWLVNRRSIVKRQPISIILIQSRKTIRLSQ